MTIDAIRAITLDVLEVHSPDESFLVETYDPNRDYTGKAASGPQGFGAEIAVALLLPVVWKLVEKLLEEAAKELGQEWVRRLIAAWKVRANDTAPAETLDTEVVEEIKRRLIAGGVEDVKVTALAATIAASLIRHPQIGK